MKYIPIILFGVSLNAFAQLFLRKGMMEFATESFSISNIKIWLPQLLSNGFLYLGFFCYTVSIMAWLYVLSKVEVSYAYPFLSIGYILTAIIGYFAFNENLSAIRIIGILVICFGVILISRS